MSNHFAYENELNKALKLDAPLNNGPAMRWQRKANDSVLNSSSSQNCSMNQSQSQKSPARSNRSMHAKTPKSSSKPTKGSKTPHTPGGDRFIPSRAGTQFDRSNYLLNVPNQENVSPSKADYQKQMKDNLEGNGNGNNAQHKILHYTVSAPSAPEGHQNNTKVLYSQTRTPGASKKATRHIPNMPERILDAPEIKNDYYINLIDWSSCNTLAVALGNALYLWDADSGNIDVLLELHPIYEYVSSVCWIKEGNFLAVGNSKNQVEIWDVITKKKLRSMNGHTARVSSLSWNDYVLSSGSRSSHIHHHDVRIREHQIATLSNHTQEVCGLKWSPDWRYLASGGNDNLVTVWPHFQQGSQPIHTFNDHLAAVKALAWCPWQPSILASGGGTADRSIKLWNCNNGSLLKSVETDSQVCAAVWSETYKELITGHGFANNQLTIWKYPAMSKVTELTGHTGRILGMALGPDATTVVSAAADETIRLWKCFDIDPQEKIKKKDAVRATGLGRQALIR